MLISRNWSVIYMQNDDNYDKNKIPTSVEIVDVPPPNTDKESVSKTNFSAGVAALSPVALYRLFTFRNLAYLGTLSRDGAPQITPGGADGGDDFILRNTFEEAAKIRHISKDNRI